MPGAAAQFFGQRAQVRGAGIFGAIDAVAEAGDLLLVDEHVLHVGQCRFFVARIEQHADDFFVGAAVQRSFQRSDAGRDGGVNIGQRGCHYARREGGRVQLMIGVEDQGDIEHVLHHVIRLFAGKRVEEIRGESELGVALDQRLASAQAIERGDDGGGLRHQARGFLLVGFHRIVASLGIVQAQHGYRGAQDVHGRGFGTLPKKFDDFLGNRAVANQARLERIEFRLLGKATVPEEINDLFKSGVVGQGMNVITLIAEDSTVPIDETNIRLGGNNAFEPRLCDWHLTPLFSRTQRLHRQAMNCGRGAKFHSTEFQLRPGIRPQGVGKTSTARAARARVLSTADQISTAHQIAGEFYNRSRTVDSHQPEGPD